MGSYVTRGDRGSMLLDHPVMIRIGNLIRWLNDKCIACVVATYSCLSKNALDVLMLLSILSLFDAMPPLPTRIAHILAGIGIALWFIYSPMLVQAKFQVLMRVALATIAFVSLCWLPAPIVYYITAVWFGIASIFKFRNAHLTATLVLIMALVHDLMDCSPHALMMLNAICGRISEAFSQPLFLQSKWGMTALGWQGILLIGIAWWLGGRTEHWYYTVRRAVMLLAWIAIALLGFMALAGAFSYIADKRGWAFPVNPLTLAPIRNCLLIVPFAVWGLHERPRRRDERYHLRLSRTVTMALPFLCILATAFYRAPMLLPIYPKRADVLFLETNRTEWRLPMHPRYGQDFWGFWSRLPDYLHLMGYRRFVPVRKLTRAKLQNASIVIIINPERSPTSGESRLLEQFIARGGGLLVMGEHTDMGGMMKHLKAWLKPFDIEFNFDSAKSIFEYWRGCYKLLPSAITAGLDEREVQISIGASLKVNPPAQPLILGRLAWSDAGNRRNVREAYLGNLEYDADEPLGDINLTAIRHYKRG
ncbi:MAG TPA: hypothetical protein EYP10_09750, partial [Armatimonadetes bacterium]|nr:hypothetical protein [Armatimonadota bacterium]